MYWLKYNFSEQFSLHDKDVTLNIQHFHLWQYLSEFELETVIFFLKTLQTHILLKYDDDHEKHRIHQWINNSVLISENSQRWNF